MVNGKAEGKGTIVYELKDKFVGEFKDDMKHGKGKYYDTEGQIYYDGDWKEGLPDGDGIEYHQNGRIKFDGDYKNGKKDGFGTKFTITG